MYSTCLFCARSLGRNEALEHFPVGRRLAYDPRRGRLWVVCPQCERWNLSPIETRWEAIEEAERAYGGASLRVATENVALAQLREGLELVRLGAPARVELAAWRYGDQFGRRRRRHAVLWTLGAGVAVTQAVAPWVGAATIAAAAGIAGTIHMSASMYQQWQDAKKVRLFVRDADETVLLLTYQNARCAALVPIGDGGWKLTFPFRRLHSAAGLRDKRGDAEVFGGAALGALATMLPHLNRTGGSARRVRDATDVLAESPTLDHLLRAASVNTEAKRTHLKIKDGESNVGALPARIRLALEMALHEEDERRAMEGELRALEERWREAEEVAAIADALI